MASNAASSVQFRVNGTEMARGRTRKTERSQSMDPRAKPRAAGRLKGKRRDNRDEREFILGPENAGNFCIARRSRGISAIVSRRLPRSRLRASVEVRNQVSHPLCLDSGRSSNRNRHFSPSVNTSRLVVTYPWPGLSQARTRGPPLQRPPSPGVPSETHVLRWQSHSSESQARNVPLAGI
jgi:hypothetical protein